MIALRHVTRAAKDFGVEILTVYGFSTENWRRDEREISSLLDLAAYFARSELAEMKRNDVRVEIIGDYRALPRHSREALERLVVETARNGSLLLVLAVNYSSRAELRDVAKGLAREVQAGLDPDAIDEAQLRAHLYTSGLPDPELVIRPGGESRVSNFLLFQAAEAELYTSDVLWPDFGRDEFARALAAFGARRGGA